MCRQNQLWGCSLLAFGVGVLIGTWLQSGIICHLLGLCLVLLGLGLARRK